MKNIIMQIIMIVLTIVFVLFAVDYFFHGPVGEKTGFFGGSGAVLEGFSDKQIVSNGIEALTNSVNTSIPTLKYTGGTRYVGETVHFRELFQIALNGIDFQDATVEDGYALYFYNIMDLFGNPVVIELETEEINALEEIPAAFIYDTENDTLHFHKSGTFTIIVNVYLETGAQFLFECLLPVEAA